MQPPVSHGEAGDAIVATSTWLMRERADAHAFPNWEY